MAILRNVEKTDTLESQRQKINLLASDVFSIGSGGSDLSTGNLKLGDGTITVPSLAFVSDATLGIYKSAAKTFGFVSGNKKIVDYSETQILNYKDVVIQQSSLTTNDTVIVDDGKNYDAGEYTGVVLTGGGGTGAIANLTVIEYAGTITNIGKNYTPSITQNIPLFNFTTLQPSGAIATADIDGINGSITNAGSGYTAGSYPGVALINGTGTGATADITVAGGVVTSVTIISSGINYLINDVLSVSNTSVGGSGSGFQYTVATRPGTVKTLTFSTRGTGVAVGDILRLPQSKTGVSSTLTEGANEITVAAGDLISGSTAILVGSVVTKTAGTGVLAANTTVTDINTQTNKITLSNNPTTGGGVTLTFATPYGTPTNNFQYTVGDLGVVSNFTITSGGNGYALLDQLSVNSTDLVQPTIFIVTSKSVQTITFTTTVSETIFPIGSQVELTDGINPLTVYSRVLSGSNIVSLLVDAGNLTATDIVRKTGTTTPTYIISTASAAVNKFFIGSTPHPNLTFFVGNTYKFDISDQSNSGHIFALSKYRDGEYSPSLISGVSATLTALSTQIIVSSATGILPGMLVTSINDALLAGTTVVSVVGTTITLSSSALVNGSSSLTFSGVEYLNGVTKSTTALVIKVLDTTPNLYYYCRTHGDMGGSDGNEALITINPTNPKVFGSNFSLSPAQISTTDVIRSNITTGNITATSFTGTSAAFGTATLTGLLTSGSVSTGTITTSSISAVGNLTIALANGSVNINSDLNIGYSNIVATFANGNITTQGILKTTNSINVNNKLTITDNTIASTTGNNIFLSPASGRIAKVDSTTALVIPVGNTAQRPGVGITENGAIRFNTQTGQYEGYSASTSSWSSLGGVRDLDGNTYIAAEASIGANDNTLYFYNDGNNTLKLTPYEFAFNTVKNVHSLNILAPTSTLWSSNSPVTLGQYINYGFNVYEVTTAGTTGGPAVPPTHSTGAVVNGTSTLTWNSSYVDELTFSKISNVNIGTDTIPTKLIINGKLRLYDDTVSTITNDLVLYPYSGKKVTITANSSLVIPAGTTAQRGVPAQGSIRYSSTLSSFEGYNGTNWTSLGGVKDVDGNTYIIPESVPGANENILYFYNNGSTTLKLSTSGLLFDAIDTITSTNNNLDLNVNTVTFNSLAFTIDNTGATSTKLLSTRTNFDFALSSGVTADPLIRLNTTGDILINKTYSTGTDTFVKVLDNELKTFDLDDVKIETFDLVLTKGTTDLGFITIFTPSTHNGAKVVLIANNINTNDREVIEYNVVSKNTDIFHTEYGNVITGADQVNTLFDFDEAGNVRLTSTLSSALTTGNVVNITVIKTIFKK